MRHTLVLVLTLVSILAGPSFAQAPTAPAATVDQLLSEQKFDAALTKVREQIDAAKKGKRDLEWAKLVSQEAQLQIALHGYETAVRDLRARAWPGQPLAQAMVAIVYSRALQAYYQSYSWEIRTRERVETLGPADLKQLTADQIYLEAVRSLAGAWKEREGLGRQPKGALVPVIHPNQYPEGIRDTLRDSLTHLFAAILADTSGWTPRQSNEVYTLDARALAQGSKLTDAALVDPGIHPLEKIAFLFHDLRKWNETRGKPGAALDARLELIGRLYRSFSDAGSREVLRAELRKIVDGSKGNPWVSMGYAALAQFWMEEPTDDSRIRARELAQAGSKLFPRSPGAARCRDILREIEQPAYALEGMQVDGPGRRSIGIKYRNLRKFYFRSYAFDLKEFLRTTKDYSLRPGERELRQAMQKLPAREWETEVPETTDFREHRAYSVPPEHAPGFYLVIGSARPGFPEQNNQLQGLQMSFGDLVLTHHASLRDGAIEAEVRNGNAGEAVAGAEVSLYRSDYNTGHQLVKKVTTDASGIARFPQGADEASRNSYFLLAEKGGQVAANENPFSVYRGDPREKAEHVFLYTDRAIYRPGQKILWKAIRFGGEAGGTKFAVVADREIQVDLRDGNSEIVATVKAKTNAYGSAAGEFVIPAGKLLGEWSIRATPSGFASVRVEEYKRPTFELKFAEQPAPMRLNREARVEGSAGYYFGLPVTAGAVKWSVRRQAILPWWCVLGGFRHFGSEGAARDQVIATGRGNLSTDGKFSIPFTPKADERIASAIDDLQYRYLVQVDVTDEGGETRSASKSFVVGFAAVQAALELSQKFYREGEVPTVRLRRTDLNGQPMAGKGEWKLLRLQGPAKPLSPAEQPLPPELKRAGKTGLVTPGDEQLPRWNPDYRPELVLRGWPAASGDSPAARGTTPAETESALTLPKLAPGAYRLVYATRDSFGTDYDTQAEFVVVPARGADLAVLPLPALFALDRATVKAGEKLRLLAYSGFSGQQMVLETFRSGQVIRRQKIVAGQDSPVIEVPMTDADRGGLAFSLRLIRDYQSMAFSDSVQVPWDNRELKLTWSTFRDKIRPGGKETWRLTIQGPNARALGAGTAEVLASMYDRSLDLFAPHSPASLLGVYPNRAQADPTLIGLGNAPGLWLPSGGFEWNREFTSLSEDQVMFYPSYGVGGPGARGGMGFGAMAESASMSDSAGMPLRAQAKMAAAPALRKKSETAGAKEAPAAAPAEDRGQANAAATAPDAPPDAIRSNFSETAFWKPQLLTGKDGSVQIEFDVPDSVTSWKVWAVAATKDLMSGQATAETHSVKELMVRPYLPRFLREGDRARIQIAINNASARELAGQLEFDVLDPATQKSVLAEFKPALPGDRGFRLAAGKSLTRTIELTAPARVGEIAIRAVARADAKSGGFSDGEVRPIPLLPGRFHLSQSRFAALKPGGKRELRFDDLGRGGDASRIDEQVVVTLDAQLFYSVLSALPYLIDDPYESVDRTLNTFVSTGILQSVYRKFPAIEKMARELSSRKTQLEAWNEPDPNRRMALEETPWLQASRGGAGAGMDGEDKNLQRVLDSRVTRSLQSTSLRALEKAQTGLGAFPWFPGGPPSPWMTLDVLYGLSKALEFGVDVPKPLVQKAWQYLHRHYLDEVVREMTKSGHAVEFVTFLNYVLSNYPDVSWTDGVFTADDRRKMLEHSFARWRDHSPYLKGYLALTLKRAARPADAKLVWDSVMDSAKTSEDEGTHWATEDRSWLWYNDTTRTHAFALRTGSELETPRPKLDGLVQWLFLNKKLNHWKSTRATAEVIYSLAHWLRQTGELGATERATVRFAGEKRDFEFAPDRYTGRKNQVVIPAAKVNASLNPIVVENRKDPKTGAGGQMFASATWHYSTEQLPKEARGDFLGVTRSFYRRTVTAGGAKLQPLAEGAKLRVGDEIEVQLSLRAKHAAEYVHLMDPRAAGFEPADPVSRHRFDLGIYWYEAIRDSGTSFFFERLPAGEYRFKYRLRASTAGTFKVSPATLQPMYAPEFNAFSAGQAITIEGAR